MMEETDKQVTENTGPFEIPAEGSLGLLALGAVGVRPWRHKRIESGFEAQLIERCKKQAEEGAKKKEERRIKLEEAKLKRSRSSMSKRTAKKILLIGWDAAD